MVFQTKQSGTSISLPERPRHYSISRRIIQLFTCVWRAKLCISGVDIESPLDVELESEGFFLPFLFCQGLSIHRRHVVTQPCTTNTAQSLQTNTFSRPTAADLSSLSTSTLGVPFLRREYDGRRRSTHTQTPTHIWIVQHQSVMEFNIPLSILSHLCVHPTALI